jgi:hypothetical protein
VTDGQPHHRRLVLDLRQAVNDPAGLAAVLGLARLLDLDPLGVFVEDEDVFCLAGLPFARELCLPMGVWRALDPVRLAVEMAGLAERARRALERAGLALERPTQFARLRGDPGVVLAAQAGAADIIAVTGAAGLPGSADFALRRLEESVLAASRSVLVLPPRLVRPRGAVAVVVAEAAAETVPLASRIAVGAGEAIVLLSAVGAGETAAAVAQVEAAGLAAARIVVRPIAAPSAEAILAALAGAAERLLVLPAPRPGAPRLPLLSPLAAARGVPVLAVVPEA